MTVGWRVSSLRYNYLRPDGAKERGEMMQELGWIRGEVDGMFFSI